MELDGGGGSSKVRLGLKGAVVVWSKGSTKSRHLQRLVLVDISTEVVRSTWSAAASRSHEHQSLYCDAAALTLVTATVLQNVRPINSRDILRHDANSQSQCLLWSAERWADASPVIHHLAGPEFKPQLVQQYSLLLFRELSHLHASQLLCQQPYT